MGYLICWHIFLSCCVSPLEICPYPGPMSTIDDMAPRPHVEASMYIRGVGHHHLQHILAELAIFSPQRCNTYLICCNTQPIIDLGQSYVDGLWWI